MKVLLTAMLVDPHHPALEDCCKSFSTVLVLGSKRQCGGQCRRIPRGCGQPNRACSKCFAQASPYTGLSSVMTGVVFAMWSSTDWRLTASLESSSTWNERATPPLLDKGQDSILAVRCPAS